MFWSFGDSFVLSLAHDAAPLLFDLTSSPLAVLYQTNAPSLCVCMCALFCSGCCAATWVAPSPMDCGHHIVGKQWRENVCQYHKKTPNIQSMARQKREREREAYFEKSLYKN